MGLLNSSINSSAGIYEVLNSDICHYTNAVRFGVFSAPVIMAIPALTRDLCLVCVLQCLVH